MYTRPGRVVLEGKQLHRVVIKIEPTNDYAQVWVSVKLQFIEQSIHVNSLIDLRLLTPYLKFTKSCGLENQLKIVVMNFLRKERVWIFSQNSKLVSYSKFSFCSSINPTIGASKVSRFIHGMDKRSIVSDFEA